MFSFCPFETISNIVGGLWFLIIEKTFSNTLSCWYTYNLLPSPMNHLPLPSSSGVSLVFLIHLSLSNNSWQSALRDPTSHSLLIITATALFSYPFPIIQSFFVVINTSSKTKGSLPHDSINARYRQHSKNTDQQLSEWVPRGMRFKKKTICNHFPYLIEK